MVRDAATAAEDAGETERRIGKIESQFMAAMSGSGDSLTCQTSRPCDAGRPEYCTPKGICMERKFHILLFELCC